MKLDFNYTGKTFLKNWWKIVRDNFQSIETLFNAHRTAAEMDHAEKSVKRRHIDDRAISSGQIDNNAVGTEQIKDKNIIKSKLSSDLQNWIGNISKIQPMAHVHENKDVLDTITSSRVKTWDSKSEAGVKKEYMLHILLNDRIRIDELYRMFGYMVVDGGVFGMGDVKAAVDGSAFGGEPQLIIDCGGFEERSILSTIKNNSVLNGGIY